MKFSLKKIVLAEVFLIKLYLLDDVEAFIRERCRRSAHVVDAGVRESSTIQILPDLVVS